MKKLFLYLLVVLTTLSSTQAASYKTAAALSATHHSETAAGVISEAAPVSGVQLRKQSGFVKTFLKLKKRFAPDGKKTGYRTQGGWAIASFACGVVSLFIAGIPLGIAAIVFGAITIAKGYQYQGLAIAGFVLGLLSVILVSAYLASM